MKEPKKQEKGFGFLSEQRWESEGCLGSLFLPSYTQTGLDLADPGDSPG